MQIILNISKIRERSDALVSREIDWPVSSSTGTDCNQLIFDPFSTKPCFLVTKFHSLGHLKLQIKTLAKSPTTFAVSFSSPVAIWVKVIVDDKNKKTPDSRV
jgi:hypothetical protein